MTNDQDKVLDEAADIPDRVKDLLEKLIPDDGSVGREILKRFWLDGYQAALDSEAVGGLVEALEKIANDPSVSCVQSNPAKNPMFIASQALAAYRERSKG